MSVSASALPIPRIEALTDEECWTLLSETDLGRLAVAIPGGVDIFPVNFLVTNGVIYFSSAPGSKLVDLTKSPNVAFEADGILDRQRWSVVVKGVATRLSLDTEIHESGVQRLHSQSPVEKWNYVRIDATATTGRRFTSTRSIT